MSDSPIGQNAPAVQPIPVHRYNPDLAARLFEEYQHALDAERAAVRARVAAYARFADVFGEVEQ